MLRGELQRRGEKVKNQLDKLTDKPTLRWIFQVLQRILYKYLRARHYSWLSARHYYL